MQEKKKLFLLLLITFLFLATGCIQTKQATDTSQFDGGVFKSADKGNTWQQRVLIPTTSGQPRRFSGADVIWMSIDPNDENAIYFGSIGNGLLYTLDGGGSWNQVDNLGNASIRTVEVSPEDKCTMYISINNVVKKTTDCMRSWQDVYFDSDYASAIVSLAIDHYDSNTVYIGSSRGDLIKTTDGGANWQTITRLKSRINKIAIHPEDSREIYVVTEKRGFFRSLDAGETWDDFSQVLKENKMNLATKDLVFVKEEPNVIFVATAQGIIRTEDRGETWEKMNIIPPDAKAMINALAVNPNNSKEFYYVTYTAFFRTLDGGESWASIKLPSTRAGWRMLIDPEKPNILYMGMRTYQTK